MAGLSLWLCSLDISSSFVSWSGSERASGPGRSIPNWARLEPTKPKQKEERKGKRQKKKAQGTAQRDASPCDSYMQASAGFCGLLRKQFLLAAPELFRPARIARTVGNDLPLHAQQLENLLPASIPQKRQGHERTRTTGRE